MCKLIPVKYHGKNYPDLIDSRICEIAGNFDSKPNIPRCRYSLHTEYSYGERNLENDLLNGMDEIKKAQIKRVPELWRNEKWATEFADFIIKFVGRNEVPEVIEIHPPFRHYCKSFSEFFSIYNIFEDKIKESMPDTKIFIENRTGTVSGKRFILSSCGETLEFLRLLDEQPLSLKMVIDYPQLISGERIDVNDITLEKIFDFNDKVKPYLHLVGGIHLWGKQKGPKRWSAHMGDLNTLFGGDTEMKEQFLSSIQKTFDDGEIRYFVPEVNSSEKDLQSIVKDMIDAGFVFV